MIENEILNIANVILVSILFPCIYIYIYIYRYLYIFFDKKIDGFPTHLQPDTFPISFLPHAELPSLEEIHSKTKGLPKKIEAAREK